MLTYLSISCIICFYEVYGARKNRYLLLKHKVCHLGPKRNLLLLAPQVETVHDMQASDFGEGLALLGER